MTVPPPRKPRPRSVGSVRLRAVRGPREDGRWYWRATRYEAGGEHSVWTGWATTAEADNSVAGLVAAGKADAPRDPDRAETVRDLCELYLGRQSERADIRPHSLVSLQNLLKRVVAGIGDVKIDRLDSATLERHRDARLRAGGAAASVRAELVRLRCAWTWGQEVGLTPPRALPRIRVTGPTKRSRQTPTRQDIGAVVAQLSGWSRAAVHLYAATGCRVGELAALTWDAVDLNRREITVTGKTGRRVVPLARSAADALAAWRDEHPPASPGAPVWGVSRLTVSAKLRPILIGACTAAGVPVFAPQGLRRSAVDVLYRSGADIATAAAIVGHSPAVALAHYRQATSADMRRAVEAADLGDLTGADVIDLADRRGRR